MGKARNNFLAVSSAFISLSLLANCDRITKNNSASQSPSKTLTTQSWTLCIDGATKTLLTFDGNSRFRLERTLYNSSDKACTDSKKERLYVFEGSYLTSSRSSGGSNLDLNYEKMSEAYYLSEDVDLQNRIENCGINWKIGELADVTSCSSNSKKSKFTIYKIDQDKLYLGSPMSEEPSSRPSDFYDTALNPVN